MAARGRRLRPQPMPRCTGRSTPSRVLGEWQPGTWGSSVAGPPRGHGCEPRVRCTRCHGLPSPGQRARTDTPRCKAIGGCGPARHPQRQAWQTGWPSGAGSTGAWRRSQPLGVRSCWPARRGHCKEKMGSRKGGIEGKGAEQTELIGRLRSRPGPGTWPAGRRSRSRRCTSRGSRCSRGRWGCRRSGRPQSPRWAGRGARSSCCSGRR